MEKIRGGDGGSEHVMEKVRGGFEKAFREAADSSRPTCFARPRAAIPPEVSDPAQEKSVSMMRTKSMTEYSDPLDPWPLIGPRVQL